MFAKNVHYIFTNMHTFDHSKLIQNITESTDLTLNIVHGGKNLTIKRNDHESEWEVIYKPDVSLTQLQRLLSQAEPFNQKILISEYITSKAKKILRRNRIAYAEVVGNIFLETDDIYIFVETKKPIRNSQVTGNRAFTKTGMKVIFLLLNHPEYLNKPYRMLASQSGVGLDTISKVFKSLLKEQYILRLTDKKFIWNNQEKLMIKWVDEFGKILKPKLKITTCKSDDDKRDWKDVQLPKDTYWGSVNAGELLTDYLIADTWTVYSEMDFFEIMKTMNWIPDPKGNITLIEKFWKDDRSSSTVPPLLVYADLIDTTKPRNIEAAKIIYEKYIKNTL